MTLTASGDRQVSAFSFLHRAQDADQVAGGWLAGLTEHAHQALGRGAGLLDQAHEANRRGDVVAQDRLAGLMVALQKLIGLTAVERPRTGARSLPKYSPSASLR